MSAIKKEKKSSKAMRNEFDRVLNTLKKENTVYDIVPPAHSNQINITLLILILMFFICLNKNIL